MSIFRKFIREENAQDLVEYGLLAGLISVVTIASLQLIGPLVNNLYVIVQNALP